MGWLAPEIGGPVARRSRMERLCGGPFSQPFQQRGMNTAPTDPVVGPWAKEKLESLQRYLDFYTKVLKNQPWQTVYVDAYAGGGRAIIRAAATTEIAPLIDENDADQLELIKGSPRVALDIANPFAEYVFIEPDPIRAAELRAIQMEYAGHAI